MRKQVLIIQKFPRQGVVRFSHSQAIRRGRGCRVFEWISRPRPYTHLYSAVSDIIEHLETMVNAGALTGEMRVEFFTKRKWSKGKKHA